MFMQSKASLLFVRDLETSSRDKKCSKVCHIVLPINWHMPQFSTVRGICKPLFSSPCFFGIDCVSYSYAPALSKYKQNYVGEIVQFTPS